MLKDTCFCGYAFAVQNKDCGGTSWRSPTASAARAARGGRRRARPRRSPRARATAGPARSARGAPRSCRRARCPRPSGAAPARARARPSARALCGAGGSASGSRETSSCAPTRSSTRASKKKTYAQLGERAQGRPGPRRWTLVTAGRASPYTLPAKDAALALTRRRALRRGRRLADAAPAPRGADVVGARRPARALRGACAAVLGGAFEGGGGDAAAAIGARAARERVAVIPLLAPGGRLPAGEAAGDARARRVRGAAALPPRRARRVRGEKPAAVTRALARRELQPPLVLEVAEFRARRREPRPRAARARAAPRRRRRPEREARGPRATSPRGAARGRRALGRRARRARAAAAGRPRTSTVRAYLAVHLLAPRAWASPTADADRVSAFEACSPRSRRTSTSRRTGCATARRGRTQWPPVARRAVAAGGSRTIPAAAASRAAAGRAASPTASYASRPRSCRA